MTAAQYAALRIALERIAKALERIADQGDNHLNPQEPPNGETPPPRPVP